MNGRPGDWNCRTCQHLNFSWRDLCQRCGEPNPGDRGDYVKPGDWYCAAENCGAHNFASRPSCYKCYAFKDESAISFDGDASRSRGGRSSWKSGDWMCSRSGCNEHNFASRIECFKCHAPRASII